MRVRILLVGTVGVLAVVAGLILNWNPLARSPETGRPGSVAVTGHIHALSPQHAQWSVALSSRLPVGNIIDVEIHVHGRKVWQTWFSNGGTHWHGIANHLPIGKTWTLDVGVFQPNWTTLDSWWRGVARTAATPVDVLPVMALRAYAHWRQDYVISAGSDMLRGVRRRNHNDTVSEGMGYGMLLAVANHDLSTFQGLWNYVQKYQDKSGLMNWKISSGGQVTGSGSATDADEDIAYALVLAHQHWPGHGFGMAAATQIAHIMVHDVSPHNRILPGDNWGHTRIMNPSYIAPAEYQTFAAFTGNYRWIRIEDANLQWLHRNVNAQTGLVPDWLNANGSPVSGTWAPYANDWYYDAVRVPWRLWLSASMGNQLAKDVLQKEARWFLRLHVVTLRSGYSLSGTPINNYSSGPFMSASAMIARDTHSILAQRTLSQLENWKAHTYYGASLTALALSTLVGQLKAHQHR